MTSENERSVAIGRLSDEQRRAYEVVLEVNQAVYPAVRPGATFADVCGVAKTAYERLGYGAYLPLESGMIVMIEPTLRIRERGGLQRSDTVLITESGFEFPTTERGFIQR